MVIIGSNNVERSVVDDLVEFYDSIMEKKNTRYEIGTLDEAECIKVFYNTFISAKISLVNMIQDVAEKVPILIVMLSQMLLQNQRNA